MKVLLPILPASLFLLISCTEADSSINGNLGTSDENKDMIEESINDLKESEKILEAESGMITFEYTGKWTGRETVWFDQFGKRVVIEQDILHSPANRNKKKMIWTGDNETSYNCEYIFMGEEKNSSENPYMRPKETELSLFAHGDDDQLIQSYKQIGDKMVSGKQASGWRSKTMEIEGWIWKGIDLEYNNSGVIKKAISFKEIKSIPKDKLDPHNGF